MPAPAGAQQAPGGSPGAAQGVAAAAGPADKQLQEAYMQDLPLTQRPPSQPLDLTGAAISQAAADAGARDRDAPSIVLPHQDAEFISHIALDIGGSLVKLVYFSPEDDAPNGDGNGDTVASPGARPFGGKLHFVKFETSKIHEVLSFIVDKGLHRRNNGGGRPETTRMVATGGGAYKFAALFQEKLGVQLEKEDEMDCLVGGCNFLRKAIRHEAFTYEDGRTHFIASSSDADVFPYLLVNIGSGVSMLKVDGDGSKAFERVSGSSLGGGTFWGLCRLLTGCRGFDEMLALSARGDNSKVDMLVGDIYGARDYSNIGLSASTIASSFGKVVGQDLELQDYNKADIAMALCRMVSYNIGHLAYLNAKRYGLKRVFFGGFFIRGHPYTMETISFAIRFWSKGEMAAMFLRHEGFLGAVGAFLKVHPIAPPPSAAQPSLREPRKVLSARFVERFSMGAPFSGGEVVGPAIRGVAEKVDWVEKFVAAATAAAAAEQQDGVTAPERAAAPPLLRQRPRSNSLEPPRPSPLSSSGLLPVSNSAEALTPSSPATAAARLNMHLGVLHYTPSCEPFPLLADPLAYDPNTQDVYRDLGELQYWIDVLAQQLPTTVDKAALSGGDTPDVQRRAAAFGHAFAAHLAKLREEPGAYGQLGLADLFEMREECLREFGFTDVYRLEKKKENDAALAALPDLVAELDPLPPPARLEALIQGVLAANIFDWGAAECVELYRHGDILEMYRAARINASRRPWRVDCLNDLADAWLARASRSELATPGAVVESPWRRVIMFVDNAGADVVLGCLPLARELLRMRAEVVLVANSLPAINDITAAELRALLDTAAALDPVLRAAREAAQRAKAAAGGRIPPYPGLPRRIPSSQRLLDLATGFPRFGSPPAPHHQQPLDRQPSPPALAPAARGSPPPVPQGALDDLESTSPRSTSAVSSPAHLPGTALPPGPGAAAAASGRGGSPAAEARGEGAAADGQEDAAAQQGATLQARADLERQRSVEDAQASAVSAMSEHDTASAAHRLPAGLGPLSRSSTLGSSVQEGGGAGTSLNRRESLSLTRSAGGSGSLGSAAIPEEEEDGGHGGDALPAGGLAAPAARLGLRSSASGREARLYVVGNGQGSPCLDLRRVPDTLADATVGADLVIIEGMGRAVHTNYAARFRCDALKLAMIKNAHLAAALFGGQLYDCVCRFERGGVSAP